MCSTFFPFKKHNFLRNSPEKRPSPRLLLFELPTPSRHLGQQCVQGRLLMLQGGEGPPEDVLTMMKWWFNGT